MTPPDRSQLESALEAVLRDLVDAENALSSANFRVFHAREAATGLQALVGLDRARQIADEVGIALPPRRVQSGMQSEAARRAAMERRRALEAERSALDAERRSALGLATHRAAQEVVTAESEGGGLREKRGEIVQSNVARILAASSAGQPSNSSSDEPSSTDRVIELLREHEGQAVPRAMIIEQFERRGWIDPSWDHPHQAIRMAIRRAEARHAVKQVGDGRYTYADPGLLGEFTGGDA